MPLDYTIPLKAQAPATNPLQMALQASQYKLASTNANMLQQQLDANTAASEAFKQATGPDGTTDYNKFRAIMAGGAGAYNLPQINNSILESQTRQQSLDTSKQALAAKEGISLAQAGFAWMQNPNASGTDLLRTLSGMHEDGMLGDAIYANATKRLLPLIDSPDALRKEMAMGLSRLSPEQQAALQLPRAGTLDNGPAINTTTTDPLTGKVTITGSLPKGLSPEAATTPTQIGITPAGAPITGTRQQFVNQATQTGGTQTGLSPYETASQGKSADYESDMNGRARAAASSSHYLAEASALLDGVKTGGGTEKWRDLAERAQALGAPREVVDKIAGGNLGDVQALSKVLMQGAIQQMQAGFTGTGAVANVDAFLKNNPNLNTDPRGIEKMVGFINGMNGAVGKEQQAYRDFINKGGNPADFPAKWNASTTMRAFTGQIKPTRTGIYNGRKVVQYSDGSVDYQ